MSPKVDLELRDCAEALQAGDVSFTMSLGCTVRHRSPSHPGSPWSGFAVSRGAGAISQMPTGPKSAGAVGRPSALHQHGVPTPDLASQMQAELLGWNCRLSSRCFGDVDQESTGSLCRALFACPCQCQCQRLCLSCPACRRSNAIVHAAPPLTSGHGLFCSELPHLHSTTRQQAPLTCPGNQLCQLPQSPQCPLGSGSR
jgi:hypothetical protein